MRKKHPEAYSYTCLLWHPKVGQKVEYEKRRYKIEKIVKGKGLRLSGREDFLYPSQVMWRPQPRDFDAVLLNLRSLWVYQQTEGNRQIVGISCNGRTLPIRGRSVQILSQILSLRAIDSKISVTINRLFEQSYAGHRSSKKGNKGHAVRISSLNTKSGGLTRPPVRSR